jgi:hypothetical protein
MKEKKAKNVTATIELSTNLTLKELKGNIKGNLGFSADANDEAFIIVKQIQLNVVKDEK